MKADGSLREQLNDGAIVSSSETPDHAIASSSLARNQDPSGAARKPEAASYPRTVPGGESPLPQFRKRRPQDTTSMAASPDAQEQAWIARKATSAAARWQRRRRAGGIATASPRAEGDTSSRVEVETTGATAMVASDSATRLLSSRQDPSWVVRKRGPMGNGRSHVAGGGVVGSRAKPSGSPSGRPPSSVRARESSDLATERRDPSWVARKRRLVREGRGDVAGEGKTEVSRRGPSSQGKEMRRVADTEHLPWMVQKSRMMGSNPGRALPPWAVGVSLEPPSVDETAMEREPSWVARKRGGGRSPPLQSKQAGRPSFANETKEEVAVTVKGESSWVTRKRGPIKVQLSQEQPGRPSPIAANDRVFEQTVEVRSPLCTEPRPGAVAVAGIELLSANDDDGNASSSMTGPTPGTEYCPIEGYTVSEHGNERDRRNGRQIDCSRSRGSCGSSAVEDGNQCLSTLPPPQSTTIHPKTPPLVEGEIVTETKKGRRLEKNGVVPCSCRSRKAFWSSVLASVVVCALAGALVTLLINVFAPKSKGGSESGSESGNTSGGIEPERNSEIPPTKSPIEVAVDAMVSLSGENALTDRASPQRRAANWILNEDSRSQRSHYNVGTVTNRYILALLYYATGGERWSHKEEFLTDASECIWYGIGCSDDEVQDASIIKSIAMQNNNLTGTLPDELTYLTNLTTLSLGNNFFSWELPSTIGQWENLVTLSLNSNFLTGTLPQTIGYLKSLKTIALSGGRKLEGGRSFEIPSNITGTFPDSIGDMESLEWASFSINSITGPLPSSVGNLKSLKYFSVWNLSLTGTIPTSITGLGNLTHLDLDENWFTGSIPPNIGRLEKLESLFLSKNKLTGPIPESIGMLGNMKNFYCSENEISGSLPDSLCDMTNLEMFKVSNNSIDGTLPSAIGKLSNLISLELDRNRLHGSIPETYGGLGSLEKIYLNGNSLTGSFPASLCNLTEDSNGGLLWKIRIDCAGTACSKSCCKMCCDSYQCCDREGLNYCEDI